MANIVLSTTVPTTSGVDFWTTGGGDFSTTVQSFTDSAQSTTTTLTTTPVSDDCPPAGAIPAFVGCLILPGARPEDLSPYQQCCGNGNNRTFESSPGNCILRCIAAPSDQQAVFNCLNGISPVPERTCFTSLPDTTTSTTAVPTKGTILAPSTSPTGAASALRIPCISSDSLTGYVFIAGLLDMSFLRNLLL